MAESQARRLDWHAFKALWELTLPEIEGVPGRTRVGEQSLFATKVRGDHHARSQCQQMQLLAPCLHDIPESLTDPVSPPHPSPHHIAGASTSSAVARNARQPSIDLSRSNSCKGAFYCA